MPRWPSLLAIALAATLASAPARADDDHHGGPGKHGRDSGPSGRGGAHFDEPQHAAVQGWYANEIQAGHCPPGLAKKRNGCLPPGQAKKRWRIGRPLPREVIFHDLPPTLVVELGPPPDGYRYARIANDVLLIAIGTGMVVDAISDLGHM